MIKYVTKDGEKLGLDTLQILLDKCKIRIYIWHDNNISGKKWIILNKKLNILDHPTLYLNYKDYKDRFPHNTQLAEQYAHYDVLTNNENISIINQNKKAQDIIQKMINDEISKRQQNQIKQKTPIKIMVWNTDSIRDFTKKSFLIQRLYENHIDIAMLQETMLTKDDKFYIKNYKIYRSNAITRKGVSIIISNTLDCDTYKTIEDLNGRYLQVKMKNEESEIFLGVAYVEPSEENNSNILPKNILKSNLFSGDLNKMNSGLK